MDRACKANQGNSTSTGAVLRELFNPGTQAILVYRFGYWSDNLRWAVFRYPLRVVHFLAQYFFAWRVGIFLHPKAQIGPGLVIHTWGGGVFLPLCPIGRDVTIVGGGVLMDFQTRSIGDEVVIGAGTKVMGKVRLGDRVKTGPNAVVDRDIPDDCVVMSVPGRVIGPIPRFTAPPRPAAAPPRPRRPDSDAAADSPAAIAGTG
jgi:serine O-acetyltransferase